MIYLLNGGPLVLDVHSRDFNPIVVIPVILCVPALIYTLLAGRDWLWASRFGTSVLDVDDIMASGQLHGVLRTEDDIHATSDFVLRLQCIRSQEKVWGGANGIQHVVVVDDVTLVDGTEESCAWEARAQELGERVQQYLSKMSAA